MLSSKATRYIPVRNEDRSLNTTNTDNVPYAEIDISNDKREERYEENEGNHDTIPVAVVVQRGSAAAATAVTASTSIIEEESEVVNHPLSDNSNSSNDYFVNIKMSGSENIVKIYLPPRSSSASSNNTHANQSRSASATVMPVNDSPSSSLSSERTLLMLKNEIEKTFNVPKNLQRLIYNGMILKSNTADDNVPLETIHKGFAKSGCFIHLMPRPAESINNGINSNGNTVNETSIDGQHQAVDTFSSSYMNNQDSSTYAINNNEHRQNIIRAKVRLYAMLLIFYYALDLLQSTSIVFGPSESTESNENSEEKLMQTRLRGMWSLVVSVIGIRVGLTGLKAADTPDTRLSRRYLMGVIFLAINFLAMAMINIWDSRDEFTDSDDDDDENGNNNHHHDSSNDPDSQIEVRFIIAMFFIIVGSIWGNCVLAAGHLHRSTSREESSTTTANRADTTSRSANDSRSVAPASSNDIMYVL